jgi:hypothetical protein
MAAEPVSQRVIEGACRWLAGDRMDIAGARWGLAGAKPILELREYSARRARTSVVHLPAPMV